MNVFEAILLGLIQGFTEFIPISSSGHLVIAQTLLSGASNHLFLEWINVGTVLALLIFFRARIMIIARSVVVDRDYRLLGRIMLATLPAGLVGFLLADFIGSNPFFGSVWTVVVMLIAVGVLLILLERLPKLSSVKVLESLSWRRALGIGIAQMLALIPGTSRSGITMAAGRLSGLERPVAAEFSFLISIPIMLGVILKLLINDTDVAYLMENFSSLLIANVAAFASGMFAVGFLMRFLKNRSLALFGWYRIGLAVVIAAVLLLQ